MKKDHKHLAFIILLFLSMIVTVFGTMICCAVKGIPTGFKVFIAIVGFCMTIVEFAAINNLNKKASNEIETEEAIEEEIVEDDSLREIQDSSKKYSTVHIQCPKCYKPFDGVVCFYCGYTSNKEKANNCKEVKNNK